ncbi:Aste57867_15782 [Aphanomyces stellatus]|uniref:Aste57867_15782 protein n=1 Tax=Aphanomyces stellatus TaxID=120398 RepID=A0A485L4Z7_9STRA|nr:hypothetical protein As57867_015726 [Aphanomyces stellatus]VFT92570.1 Aste57867_15782 [Aphanomyces stellatus]
MDGMDAVGVVDDAVDSISCPHPSARWSEFIMMSTISIASLLMLVRALFGRLFGRHDLKSKSSAHLIGGRKNFKMRHQETMQNVDQSVLKDIETLGDSVLDGYCTIKKGATSTTWKKRWVVVDAYARVKYYSNAESSRRNMAPKGTFTVLSVDVVANTNQPTLEVRNTLGGTYFFHFEDDIKMQKWLVVLKSRAMQSAINGRIDPVGARDPAAPRMKHDLTVLVETFDILAHKDTVMRSFFAVVKFKAELHDLSVIPVKQTNQRSCDNSRMAKWNESLHWSFDDHECGACDECMSVGLVGSFGGLPDLLVVNIFEVTMRVKTTKIGRVFVSLKDLFGPTGLTKSSVDATWPILASSTRLHDEKESILGTLRMKLEYAALSPGDANAAETTIVPFLTSAPSDVELLGEFDLDLPLQDVLDVYYANQAPPPDGEIASNPIWAHYIKERGDTEMEMHPWEPSPQHGGLTRVITFRSLTHAPIGPSSTMTTNTWHVTGYDWANKPVDGPTQVKFQIKVKLHDIPYGDIFTVEHELLLTKTATNGIAIKVSLGIPFSSGCMFKSKIISQTKSSVLESYAMWFRLLKEMHNQGGAAPTTTTAAAAGGGSTAASSADEGGGATKKRTALVRMSSVIDEEVALEEIFENQRMHIFGKWGPNYLWPTDRPRFSNRHGDKEMSFNQVECPPNWTWTSEWKVDMKYTDCDEEGWSYASDFPRFKVHLAKGKSNARKVGCSVRRRRWVRTMCLDKVADNLGPL